MHTKHGEFNAGDTVFFWHNGKLDEAEIIVFGGNNQVLLNYGDEWLLKRINEVKLGKDVYESEWKHYNF